MLAWHRAASLAIISHILVFLLFSFKVHGVSKDYLFDFVSLGSILRLNDVSFFQEKTMSGTWAPEISVASDIKLRQKMWLQGIQYDKPNIFSGATQIADSRLLRFVGESVSLDVEPVSGSDDIPAASLMDLRLENH